MVAAARELLETEGHEALTMRRVAARLGIREPSLYKHCRNRDELLAGVVASSMRELIDGRREALQGATDIHDALTRLAAYQRTFAARHPHLYRLMFDRPFPAELLATQVDADAWQPVIELLGSVERHWAAFAFAHGMLELERMGRMRPGPGLEAVWKVGLDAFAGIARPLDETASQRELQAYRQLVTELEAKIAAFRHSCEE
jgi:AcrR family transcriptional regulator